MLALTEAPEIDLNPVWSWSDDAEPRIRPGDNRNEPVGEVNRSEGKGERKRLEEGT